MKKDKPDPAKLRCEFWSLPDDAFVDRDIAGAAVFLGRDSMESYAIKGGGVPYTKIGRRALYLKRDVLAWAAANGRRVENTAQLTKAGDPSADVEDLLNLIATLKEELTLDSPLRVADRAGRNGRIRHPGRRNGDGKGKEGQHAAQAKGAAVSTGR